MGTAEYPRTSSNGRPSSEFLCRSDCVGMTRPRYLWARPLCIACTAPSNCRIATRTFLLHLLIVGLSLKVVEAAACSLDPCRKYFGNFGMLCNQGGHGFSGLACTPKQSRTRHDGGLARQRCWISLAWVFKYQIIIGQYQVVTGQYQIRINKSTQRSNWSPKHDFGPKRVAMAPFD